MGLKIRRFFWKLSDKLSNLAFIRHMSFLWHWKNFFFLLKYPFYRVYNRWTGKFMGYKYTEFDSVPDGWRIAFGKQMSRDIKAAGKMSRKRLKKHLSWKKMITFEQIKEKYGGLCLYASATQEIQDVLDKYETLSYGYCIACGKPARYRTRSWIEYYCEDCFVKNCLPYNYRTNTYGEISSEKLNAMKKECRLTKKDIPHGVIYTEGKNGKPIKHKVDYKKRYDIDFEKLWGLGEK